MTQKPTLQHKFSVIVGLLLLVSLSGCQKSLRLFVTNPRSVSVAVYYKYWLNEKEFAYSKKGTVSPHQEALIEGSCYYDADFYVLQFREVNGQIIKEVTYSGEEVKKNTKEGIWHLTIP